MLAKKVLKEHDDYHWPLYDSANQARRYTVRRRYDSILNRVNIKPRDLMLDLGCGDGVLSLLSCKHGAFVVGIDISRPNIQAAKRRIKAEDLWNTACLILGDVENLPIKSSTFDICVCSEVLEFLENAKNALSELARSLKNVGRFVVTFPNAQYPPRAIRSPLGSLHAIRKGSLDMPRLYHGRFLQKSYVAGSIIKILKVLGLEVTHIEATSFHPGGKFPLLLTLSRSLDAFFTKIFPFSLLGSILILQGKRERNY